MADARAPNAMPEMPAAEAALHRKMSNLLVAIGMSIFVWSY
jgi:hypothetical protein